MKKCLFYLFAVFVTISASPVLAQTTSEVVLGPNLIENGSFENDTAEWNIRARKGHAEIVNDQSHGGTHSLYYHADDIRNKNEIFSPLQRLNVKPGDHFVFSAWIKGENIEGKVTKGARVYVQSSGKEGFISGQYPNTTESTFGWQKISGEYIVPNEAVHTSIGIYLHSGAKGSVWFDDVEAHVIKPPAFTSYLLYPNYRNTVAQNDRTSWKYLIRINSAKAWGNSPVKIINELVDDKGKVLLRKENSVSPSEESVNIEFAPPANLAKGDYLLKQHITSPDGSAHLNTEHEINVVDNMPQVYIDGEGFTVVNGKRFFPMGVYGPDQDLELISQGGFNTVLSYTYGIAKDYKDFLKQAQENNLKVIYTLENIYPKMSAGKLPTGITSEEAYDLAMERVHGAKDSPALLAWYTNDEMSVGMLPKLKQMYDEIKHIDKEHPTFQVITDKMFMDRFFDVTDIQGTDLYPVGGKYDDLTNTSKQAQVTADATHGVRGFWFVPQIYDKIVYGNQSESHPPSLDEMRNQAYQAIIHGAKGLIWYQYSDLKYKDHPRNKKNIDPDLLKRRWKDVSAMAKEINAFVPTILNNEKVLLDVSAKSEIEIAAWKQGNKLAIVMANPYYQEKNITFSLPKGWAIKDANQGEIKSTFVDDKATFALPAVGSGIFYLVKK